MLLQKVLIFLYNKIDFQKLIEQHPLNYLLSNKQLLIFLYEMLVILLRNIKVFKDLNYFIQIIFFLNFLKFFQVHLI